MPKVHRTCQRCGQEFSLYPSQVRKGGGKFCSRACMKHGEVRSCPTCGEEFYVPRSRVQRGEGTYCSRACGNPARGRSGPENGNWKGGRFTRSDGYVAVLVGGGTYRLEHDLIMEAHLGRGLVRGENVHHKNGVRDDNRLENLKLETWSSHIRDHHPREKMPDRWWSLRCDSCGQTFKKRLSQVRKTTHHFCTRSCYIQARRSGVL